MIGVTRLAGALIIYQGQFPVTDLNPFPIKAEV